MFRNRTKNSSLGVYEITKMKKLFDVPDSYKEHITKFDSSDGFLALGIIVTYFVVMTISGIIVQYISQLQITIIGGEINVLQLEI